jgi:hypothetical protein
VAEGAEAHVGGCDACQRALQRLVGSMPCAVALPASHRTSDEEPPTPPGHEPEGRIGAGGMGVVWRVRDLRFPPVGSRRALA